MAALFLLQMAGAPGAGKSTLARAIGAARSAVILDNDVIKSAILNAEGPWSLAGRAAYEVLFALAADLLAQGRSVILDSPSHYPQIPARGMEIARNRGAAYRFVECVCGDQALLEQRLALRTPHRSQMRGLGQPPPDAGGVMPAAKRIGVHLWQTCRPESNYLTVDGSASLDTCLLEALRYIDA